MTIQNFMKIRLTSPKPLAEPDVEARAEHVSWVFGPRLVELLIALADFGHVTQQLIAIQLLEILDTGVKELLVVAVGIGKVLSRPPVEPVTHLRSGLERLPA